MEFNPGFDIIPTVNPMGFKYGADVFGPQVENRYLRDIRGTQRNARTDAFALWGRDLCCRSIG